METAHRRESMSGRARPSTLARSTCASKMPMIRVSLDSTEGSTAFFDPSSSRVTASASGLWGSMLDASTSASPLMEAKDEGALATTDSMFPTSSSTSRSKMASTSASLSAK